MEAVASEIPDGSQRFSVIIGFHSLRRVFHHFQIVLPGNLHDRIHLAGHAGVVYRNDRLCFFCDRLFDQLLVYIHGIRPDIHKHDLRPSENKGVGRGNKGIRRHDHLVSRMDIAEISRHFQCMGTGSRQKYLIHMETFFHP